jgi:hypothetical protein
MRFIYHKPKKRASSKTGEQQKKRGQSKKIYKLPANKELPPGETLFSPGENKLSPGQTDLSWQQDYFFSQEMNHFMA